MKLMWNRWSALWTLCLMLYPAAGFAQLPYAESFDAIDGASWPTPWTTMSFYLTVSDIQSNRGRISGQAANGSGVAVARMLLPGFAETDIEAEMTFEFEDAGNQGIGFYARQNGGTLQEYAPPGQGYGMFMKGAWGWPEDLGIWREIGGIETQFATGYNPISGGIQNGVRYRLRYRVTQHAIDSTLIQAKVWPEASSEPAGWTVETFDSQSQLQGTAGGFALDIYNFQGTGHIFIDDLLIQPYPGTVSAPAPAPVAVVAMSAPRPHPVRGATRFVCSLPERRRATLRVFDPAGRRVADVFDGVLGAGSTTIEWRSLDAGGGRLPAGVYLVQLRAGSASAVRRMVIAG